MHFNIKIKIFSFLLLICLPKVLSIQVQGNKNEKKFENLLLLSINFTSYLTNYELKHLLCFFKKSLQLNNDKITTPFQETCDTISLKSDEDEYFGNRKTKDIIFNNHSQSFREFFKKEIEFLLQNEIEKKSSNFSGNPINNYSIEEINLTINETDSLVSSKIDNISENSIIFSIKSRIKICWFTYSLIEFYRTNKNDMNIKQEGYIKLHENEIFEINKKELKEKTRYQLKINIFTGIENIKETKTIEFQTLSSKILFEEIFVQNINSSLIIRTGCYDDCEIYFGLDVIPTFSPNTFQFINGLNGNNKNLSYFQKVSSAQDQIYTLKIDNLKKNSYKLWIRGIRNADRIESALYEYEFESKENDYLQESPLFKLIEVSKSKNTIKFSFQILNSDGHLFLGLDYFEKNGQNYENNSIPYFNQLSWGRNQMNEKFINFTKAYVEKDHIYTFEYKKKIKDKHYILYYGISEKDLKTKYEGRVAYLLVENGSIKMEVIIFIYYLLILMICN